MLTPTVATAAIANPSPTTANTTTLSVLGADSGGEANLSYAWATTGYAAAPVVFSSNGVNASKNTTATFTAAGNYNFIVTITNQQAQSVTSSVVVPVTFGIFNNGADIGSPSRAGSLSYNASSSAYTVNAGGSDIAGTSDQFRYTYTTFNVNAQITARVTSVSNTNSSAKAGVMFRNSTAANASYAFAFVTPGNNVEFETRSANGAATSYNSTIAAGISPLWVRLIRNGAGNNQFSAYYSINGTSWTQLGTAQTVTMNAAYLAGLAVTSRNTAVLNTSVMDNVSMSGLSERGFATLNSARTTFVADNGQLLRSPFTSTEGNTAVPESQIAAMKNLGFNTIHLYAEGADANYPNSGTNTPGYQALAVDKIVQYCQDQGLYCIIVAGGTLQWIEDFWKFYAPRYANDTNVIYEIANEPAANISMAVNEACYTTIRSYAPNMPVLLFTDINVYGSGAGTSVLQKIQTFNQADLGNANAVWTNIAYAFHGYAPDALTEQGVQTIINGGYQVFMTEANSSVWGTNNGGIDIQLTQWLEQTKISWITFLHVPPFGVAGDVTDPTQYVNPVNDSGLSWTPDYGTWPAVRGAYNAGNVPWATASNFVNNQLTGTLHIEAENYDSGGQSVAYYDTTPGDLGGQYRPGDNVDITTTTDFGGGYVISSTASGEWFEYTINVAQAGYYRLDVRYSNATGGAAIDVTSLRDGDLTGNLTLPTTGGLSSYSTLTTQVFLGGGQQILKFGVPTGGFNLNWFELTPTPLGAVSGGTYLIVNRASGMALQLDTTTNNVIQEPFASSSTLQQWSLQSLGAGQYDAISVNNGSYWTTFQRSTLGTGPGYSASSVVLRPIGNGFYRMVDSGGGLDFEVQGNSTAAGASIDKIIYSGLPNQQWAVVATSDQIFPTGLITYRDSAGNVQLSWTAASGAVSYNVKRATASGGPYTTIATGVSAAGYVDTTALANTAYYYVISAVSSTGKESINSTEAVAPSYGLFAVSQDIGSPGPTGSGGYNSGTQTYTVAGGGADIWNTADQFHFLSESVIGDSSIIARVTGVQNTNTWAKAGVMFRDSAAAGAMFANVDVTPGQGVSFQWCASTGGNCANTQITGILAPTWVKLVRSGNSFSAFYAKTTGTPTATDWIAVGTSQTIAMSSTAQVGLAVTSHNNGTLCTSTFTGVQVIQGQPTVATQAAATPSPVTATTTNLSVLGADAGGEANLTYTWSTTGTPPAPVVFSANGSNVAKNTTATFIRAGTYNFLVCITNGSGLLVCSSVVVTVNQSPSGVSVTPLSAPITVNASKQFSATEIDQFGVARSSQPAFTWTITGGGGSVSSSGLYTAPATAGSATVQATAGAFSGTAAVTVTTQTAPTIATAAAASPSPAGTSTVLTVLGASSAGESNLTYNWSLTGTPPGPASFSANGSNAAKNTTVTFAKAGTYSFTVTITDQVGLSVTSSVSVTVNFGLFTDSNDIGSPSPAGSLSYNASSGAYTVTAGGADIWGTSDQFRYNYETYSGTGQITARVTSVSNTNASAKAGAMFRDSTAANAAYAFAWVSPGNNVAFETRASNGTSSNYSVTVAAGGSPVWVRLLRSGVSNNQFSAYYSRDGVTWSQVGTTQTVTMATTALAGLAVTSHNQGTLNTSVLDNVLVSAVPTFVAAAWSTPSTDGGTNAQLTVLGADPSGEANLTYTWTMTSGPAAVSFSTNATNAAKTTVATFTKAGNYTFQATIKNAGGVSATSSVSVTVNQTYSGMKLTPASPNLTSGNTQQFTATALDQFGQTFSPQPAVTWTLVSGPGTLTSGGLFTPPYANGSAVVRASSGGYSATATVTFSSQAQWNAATSSSWATSGNWKDSSTSAVLAAPGIRGLTGDTVLFAATTVATVTLDGASPTLAGMTFNNATRGYTIAQGTGGSLTLQASTSATVSVVAGSHAISAAALA